MRRPSVLVMTSNTCKSSDRIPSGSSYDTPILNQN